MDTAITHSAITSWGAAGAYLALAGIALSAIALVALHVASPEFSPSWRMVSEYANGEQKWLLTLVFLGWAIGSLGLLLALMPLWSTTLGKFALVFLALAAVGQLMGMAFDINHPLHGAAAFVGIPSLCAAAVLVTMAMGQHGIEPPPMWTAQLPWISFVLMAATLFLFFSSLSAAGVQMTGTPLTELPPGVHGYVGVANRLLFAACYLWAGWAAFSVLHANKAIT
jgi:hypothetical protein